jgi:acyl carrier protein
MTTPTLDEVAQALSQMVADKMDIDVASIRADSSLQSLGLDSLDIFDLIFSAEDHFKIKVPNDQIKIETLQDVSMLVHKLTVEQNK